MGPELGIPRHSRLDPDGESVSMYDDSARKLTMQLTTAFIQRNEPVTPKTTEALSDARLRTINTEPRNMQLINKLSALFFPALATTSNSHLHEHHHFNPCRKASAAGIPLKP
ncbi:hypothetical protein K432DRAFT_386036 [Lepidopterella palustris CBS 459.81]|uniref:Uncharacterized protein n=1 Tax=Lepidopterella palustris CBS 459.81 TaxID=1314670 RepID=A0A8E2E1W5_9PEZI|nr:hypothetical protein K432DRAFT_386036 [Lepidopterella palustris CBS 459.81]